MDSAGVQRKLVHDALLEARGFIRGAARAKVGGMEAVRPVLTSIERAIGSLLPATLAHDRGAYARCSGCGRYSADRVTIAGGNLLQPCDCGRADHWTGSFVTPGPDAEWSIGVHERRRAGEEVGRG